MKQFKGTPGPWVFDDLSMKIKGTGDIEGMTVIANNRPTSRAGATWRN